MLFLYAADDQHLSRLDPGLLSEQASMEILAEGFKNKSYFQDINGNYTDCHEWDPVITTDGMVVSFNLRQEGHDVRLEGSLLPQFIPETVQYFGLVLCGVTGTIDVGMLPRSLLYLLLNGNKLEGTFAIESLPLHLLRMDISRNQFNGKMLTESLPQSVEVLIAESNRFQGSIDLSDLPGGLNTLRIGHNSFEGDIDISNLPAAMEEFDVSGNEQSSVNVHCAKLPRALQKFQAEAIGLSGELVCADLPLGLSE